MADFHLVQLVNRHSNKMRRKPPIEPKIMGILCEFFISELLYLFDGVIFFSGVLAGALAGANEIAVKLKKLCIS